MKRPIRIAVLECDTPPERINLKYDGYYGVFSKLLRRSAEILRHEQLDPDSGLEISRWDVVSEQAYPALEDVDGIVLTGSKHNAFDDSPWILKLVEFTRNAIQDPRVKLLGVCFGHQIIARALDAQVSRSSAGWEVSVCEVRLTPAGKELFGLDTLQIHQMHRDIVSAYPPDIIPLGDSPICQVQGMFLPGRFITVQGHPEFNDEITVEVVILRGAQGIFTKEQTEDGLSRAGRPHDGVAVGMAFLKLMIQ
ncbi:hypothetical protein ASPSYDRAFT_157286 [Aspergillus sydowii CBS 593.65]|uniref:Glutamine amidotransferase domain-containing protein n=1 Tax=Aspergillus sydowii CBS 593.65 TaxID=1036612 RepID=A0A1L9T9K1_9EURO|nr:uncharacterized protein ASPSYDRAFT_157286 [Aspergillus sydowii CBS 593.65]OJJ56120.1 hypothetical protein ASPSYDRAFT_157286 [Aspergillus sydowii CBS 593.65]